MPDRFDKFTDRARHVLQLAQEEAQRFQHNYIGTEHILLGLIREQNGIAARVLERLGVGLDDVRGAVELIIGRGEHTRAADIGLTPRAKKVIEFSVDEARRLNHHYIGTEHLLLGLLREGEGLAAGVLESLGTYPPGRVWFPDDYRLADRLRHRPASVVLLTNADRAAPAGLDLAEHILRTGHLTDERGRRLDLRQAAIIVIAARGTQVDPTLRSLIRSETNL
jgi:ATP-dependent Clp protease ATP-binding subunit ClpA